MLTNQEIVMKRLFAFLLLSFTLSGCIQQCIDLAEGVQICPRVFEDKWDYGEDEDNDEEGT